MTRINEKYKEMLVVLSIQYIDKHGQEKTAFVAYSYKKKLYKLYTQAQGHPVFFARLKNTKKKLLFKEAFKHIYNNEL